MSKQLPFSNKPKRGPLKPLPDAIRIGNRRSDYIVYAAVIAVLAIPALIFTVVSIEYSLPLVGLTSVGVILIGFFAVRIQQIMIFANSMRLQSTSYTQLRDDSIALSEVLGLPPVDILSTQDPRLNAYAMGFAKPYTIVLHSATIEQMTYDEMLVILLHEMGHIRYKHTFLMQFLLPLQVLPLIGSASGWVINFWTRRSEYTCDRLAVAYTGDPERVIRALIKVHAGPFIGEHFTKEEAMYQDSASRGLLRRFAQTFSTHPFLVNRIKAIIRFADQQGYSMAEDIRAYVRTAPKS